MDNIDDEIELLKSTIGIKVTKKMMKYMKELSKLAKLCDLYEIPFKFYIENEISLKEKNNEKIININNKI